MRHLNEDKLKRKEYTIIFLFSFVLLLSYIVMIGYDLITFSEEVKFFERQYMDNIKTSIKKEVENRLTSIEYQNDELMDKGKEEVYAKINYLVRSIDDHIISTQDTSKDILQNDVVEYVSKHDYSDINNYYFVMNLEGEMLWSGLDENYAGENLLNAEDLEGNVYVKDMLFKARISGEGFVQYKFPKEKDGEEKLKISYIKKIPEVDLIIGTGFYLEDLEIKLKEEVYEELNALYRGKENYLFIVNKDGSANVFAVSNMENKKMPKDLSGEALHEKFLTVFEQGPKFFNYKYYKRGTDSVSQKISYIVPIPEWDVYIGYGVYLDDFYASVEDFRQQYLLNLMMYSVKLFIIFFILALLVVYLTKKYLDEIIKNLIQNEMIYGKFIRLTKEAIVIISETGEIKLVNPAVEKMVGRSQEEILGKNYKVFCEKYDDTIYRIKSTDGRITYVEKYSDKLYYNHSMHKVVFLYDITDQLKQQKKLHNIAITDELTGLYNRRKFNQDFEYHMSKVKSGSDHFCLAVLDLDHFKSINDRYGHDIGDKVLERFGEIFNKYSRDNDVLYRYGGEEFFLILENISIDQGKKLLERINIRLADYSWVREGLKVTFTAGIMEIKKDDIRSLEYYLKKLDRLLYYGKDQGRACVITDEEYKN